MVISGVKSIGESHDKYFCLKTQIMKKDGRDDESNNDMVQEWVAYQMERDEVELSLNTMFGTPQNPSTMWVIS